jgi:hypothetical protein
VRGAISHVRFARYSGADERGESVLIILDSIQEESSYSIMSKRLLRFVLFIGLLCVSRSVRAQENEVDVAGCDLARNPNAFDGKLIRVRGMLNVHFEDFSLGIRDCDAEQGIWLAFGGDVPGIVASTVNDAFRKPGSDLKVNDVSYGIKKDDSFRKLYALIAARHGDKPDYRVTATLTGMFFAGRENRTAKGTIDFVGYGHLGCCSLLVITEVSDVDSVPLANLNLHGVLVGVDGKPVEGFTVMDDVLGGTPPERQKTVTNRQGEFAFSNSGQQLRFENPNYRPLALKVEPGGALIRVRLEDAKKSDWVLASCREVNSSSRIGFSILFVLPKKMESSPFASEGVQSVFIYPRGGEPTSAELIVSRSSEEITDAADSLGSEWFEERWVKDSAGNVVGMDARGRMKNGGYWRTAIFSGHVTASYRLRSAKQRNALDQIIDSACTAKP